MSPRLLLSGLLAASLAFASPVQAASLVLGTGLAGSAPVVRMAPVPLGGLSASPLRLSPSLTPGLAPSLLTAPALEAPVLTPALGQPSALGQIQLGVADLQAAPADNGRQIALDALFLGRGPQGDASGPVSDSDLLGDLARNTPSAVVFDYDNTLVDRGATGLSDQPRPEVVAGIVALLKAGLPVVLATSRNFDRQAADAPFPTTVYQSLVAQIPAELRRNLFFSGGVGGELVLFDEKGEPERALSSDWTPAEKTVITALLNETRTRQGLGAEEVAIVADNPAQFLVKFKKDDPRGAAFAKELSERFVIAGIAAPVLHYREFVYFSKFDKGQGLKLAYAAMRARGHGVSETTLAIVGDEFKPRGGDAAMALAFPDARAYTVGDAGDEALPANVRRLSLKGASGSLAILQAVLAGVKAPAKRSGLSPAASRWAAGGAGAAAAIAIPWLLGHPDASAMAGTGLLTIIGIPQIIKNFRLGRRGTKDLAVGSYLFWFAASCLLTAASVLRGADAWWIGSNVAGIAASLTVLLQIGGSTKKALLIGGAIAAAAFLPIAAGPLASGIFMGAMALLLIMNIPQIRANLELYRKEGRAPQGVSPLYPGLVAAGSLLHLIAAIHQSDVFWAINASFAVLSVLVVLGQLYLPRAVNAALSPLFPKKK